MKAALAQLNPTVADISGNTAKVLRRIDEAESAGAQLIAVPELVVFGYPPKDLLLRRTLVDANLAAVEAIAARCKRITAIVGYVDRGRGGNGKGLLNAAAVCHDGRVQASYAKMLLPTYDVFDETRHFDAGSAPCVCEVAGHGSPLRVGVTICEDLWNDHQFEGRRVYGVDPIALSAQAGAQLIVNISGSPFRAGVQESREFLFAGQAREHGVPICYVNQVGGNDDLLFDGAGLVIDASGRIRARGRAFDEDLLVFDTDSLDPAPEVQPLMRLETYPDRVASVRAALVLGIRDYMRKCGFERAVVGLSGGIDSALTAAIAVEALGIDRVYGVAMPSRFSSEHSLADARVLADNLGIALSTVSIEDVHRAMEASLHPHFEGTAPGVAEENIQARIRGQILMALSNKHGWLLLTTGNKSELAVGYCTLYGDMCGGLAVLSDVPKTMVYALARHINASVARPCIPQRCIEKPPSAELRADQTDQDSLPSYDVLDAILEAYVERDLDVEEVVALGFERATVESVALMVDRNEYKRKQAPLGLKVTSRAFGTGRRMPIAAKYR